MKGKSAKNLSLNTELTKAVLAVIVEHPRKGRRNLSELTETLWISFLRKRGVKLPASVLLKK